MESGRELLVNVRVRQVRFVACYEKTRNGTYEFNGKNPRKKSKKQVMREYMDGIVRTLGGGGKAGQMTKEKRAVAFHG